jgi:hypothetical protein
MEDLSPPGAQPRPAPAFAPWMPEPGLMTSYCARQAGTSPHTMLLSHADSTHSGDAWGRQEGRHDVPGQARAAPAAPTHHLCRVHRAEHRAKLTTGRQVSRTGSLHLGSQVISSETESICSTPGLQWPPQPPGLALLATHRKGSMQPLSALVQFLGQPARPTSVCAPDPC